MKLSLEKKIVLVTGGSKGIGAAAVRALADAGARVICQYNHSESDAKKVQAHNPGKITLSKCDLSSDDESRSLISDVLKSEGRLDVLINNAGIALNASMEGEDDEWLSIWDKTLTVNLRAAALLCKHAVSHFTKVGTGIIINVSSRAAHRGDTKDYIAYAASKGGMEALTKSLARAYGKEGIVVFGVAPGFTRTTMAQEFIDTYGEEYALNDIALNRLTEPEDIAPLFVFLASGLATHATGTTIDVNAASYVR